MKSDRVVTVSESSAIIAVSFISAPFDLVKGPVIDSLHCVYLGVVRHLLNLWFESRGQPYYIGDKVLYMPSAIDWYYCACTSNFLVQHHLTHGVAHLVLDLGFKYFKVEYESSK